MGTDVSRSGKDITTTQPWQALEAHKPILAARHLRELFADNPARGRELTIDVGDLHIDYSKHRIDAETIELLLSLCLLYTSPSPRDRTRSRMPSSA